METGPKEQNLHPFAQKVKELLDEYMTTDKPERRAEIETAADELCKNRPEEYYEYMGQPVQPTDH